MSGTSDERFKSTADKLIGARALQDQQQEKLIENIEDYSKALNGIVATEYGQQVFKTFIKALGVFTPRSGRDGVALIEDTAKRNFYLQFVRPFLSPEIRQKIES